MKVTLDEKCQPFSVHSRARLPRDRGHNQRSENRVEDHAEPGKAAGHFALKRRGGKTFDDELMPWAWAAEHSKNSLARDGLHHRYTRI
jgi:hypothetical protein